MTLSSMPQTRSTMATPSALSPMELAVLRGLANGFQSKELAGHLKRSRPTIEAYVRSLFAKFNAKSRAHLVAIALCKGTLEAAHLDFPYAS